MGYKQKRYSSAGILAMNWCCDIKDIKSGVYQPGYSDKPIYVINDDYFCATPINKKPAKHRNDNFEWEKYKSDFAESLGWQIWIRI